MILRRQKLTIISMSGIKKDRVVLLGALSYVYFYAILVHLAKSEKYSRGSAPDDKFRPFGTQFLQRQKPICPNNSWISPWLYFQTWRQVYKITAPKKFKTVFILIRVLLLGCGLIPNTFSLRVKKIPNLDTSAIYQFVKFLL